MAITKDLIRKYYQPVYIETGSAGGNTLQQALEAGVQHIHGIELNGDLLKNCKGRFRGNKAVNLHHGHSEQCLGSILKNLNCRALIYLDAHKVSEDGPGTYPLWKELAIIKMFRKYGHTIMIDDIRLCGDILPPLNEVMSFIASINRKYQIAFEDSITNDKDTLVAYL